MGPWTLHNWSTGFLIPSLSSSHLGIRQVAGPYLGPLHLLPFQGYRRVHFDGLSPAVLPSTLSPAGLINLGGRVHISGHLLGGDLNGPPLNFKGPFFAFPSWAIYTRCGGRPKRGCSFPPGPSTHSTQPVRKDEAPT